MPSLSGSLYSELEPNDTQNGAGLINVHNIPPYDQYSHGGLQVAHQERSPYDENLPQAVPVLIEKQYAPTVAPVFEGSGEKCYPSTALMADQNQPDRETGTGPKRRHLWKWIIIVLLIVVIVVIAVVVGAVVATRKNQNQTISQPSSPTTAPSASPTAAAGASNPSQASPPLLSTFGAFNGTGIAAINPMNNKDALWVFYQDHTAALKYSAFSESGTWGSGMPVGVTNVANATSLTAIAYQPLGLTVYHVFYTDQSGTINDVLYTNVSKSWFAGNISSQGWQLLSGGSGAMSAVFNNVLGKDPSSGGGLRLYAGGEDGQVHEYASDQNTGSWDEGFTFDGTNGYAGTAPEQAGGLTTLHLLNSDNRLELWWRNTNSNTAAYPSGVDASFPVLANSSVTACAGDAHAYYLDPNSNVNAISWVGMGPSELWNISTTIPGAVAIPSSTVADIFVTMSGEASGSTHLYFQSNGTNIVEYVGSVGSFQYTSSIPI